jgi:two-component system sensor histidine kinase BarA
VPQGVFRLFANVPDWLHWRPFHLLENPVFKELSIKSRMLLHSLLPSCLLATILGAYFIVCLLSGMHEQLQQHGQLIIRQLATLAAIPMQQQDLPELDAIARRALELPDVRSVSLLTPAYVPLASAGPKMLSPAPQAIAHEVSTRSAFDTTRMLLPVTLSDDAQASTLGWVELELSHQTTLVAGYRSLLISLGMILLVLGLTTALSLRMSKILDAPLRRFREGIQNLKDGRLDTRIDTRGSRELNELASGINQMAMTLQDERNEMQHSIDQAIEDARHNLEIIEIQNIELNMARKEALEASRIKSEFLANMSHEIRTPLNGIIGFANLLYKTPLTSRQLDYLQTLQTSADNLLNILTEVLDFSKIEAGKLTLESMPFNLRDMIQDCLSILAPAAHEKQLELVSLIYRDTPCSLIGDPLHLQQILTNLISNAIKFTAHGSIVVRAMLEEDSSDFAQLRISVQDSGPGLDAAAVLQLFQPFNQLDNSLTRQVGGSGLGLAISKRLIEMMGGEIGVESLPGEGSEFWISINLAKAEEEIELPPAILLGRAVAVFESHELARNSLQHQLVDCGLQVQAFDNIDELLYAVASRQQGPQAIGLAVLGINSGDMALEQIGQYLRELQQLDCKTLVLSPTTEQNLLSNILPDSHCQLQFKPACTRKLMRALGELVNPRIASLEPPAPKPAELLPDAQQPHILCVDDSPANLLLVQTLLTGMGARVTVVDSGYAALEAVASTDFDLVFMDIQMPGMDGRQTTIAIRQRERELGLPTLPVVALTAHAMPNERRSLLQDGMDDYATKPISEQQLGQTILKWTGYNLIHPSLLDGATQRKADTDKDPLAVLDPDEALELAGGKADLADDMLSMLLASLDAEQSALRMARAANDRSQLAERVHRLLGATRYCGVPQLRAACQQCEILLKQDAANIAADLERLDAAISRLLQVTGKTP